MVQIIPEAPSFGMQFARSMGAGLGAGISKGADLGMQMALEKYKQKQRQELMGKIEADQSQGTAKELQGQPQEDIRQKFLEALPQIEQAAGRELSPQDLDAIWNKMSQPQLQQQATQQSGQESDPFLKAKKYAAAGEHELARLETERAKSGIKKSASEQKLAFDETKDYRTHVAEQARSAEELEPVLNQMERLIKSKKLTNPVVSKLADKFGVVGLLDPTSQQFNALSVGFLKDAKTIFGSRVTNFDLETYLDKIPRLAQTDAGKKALIDNFRTLGEASKIRNKAKNQIIKQNKGVPPLDLEEQVSEKVSPQLDKLAEKFNKSFYESSRSASGKYLMRHPNGTLGEVPQDKIEEAIKKGYQLE